MKTLPCLILALLAAGLVRAEQLETGGDVDWIYAASNVTVVFPEGESGPVPAAVYRGDLPGFMFNLEFDEDYYELPFAPGTIHAHLDHVTETGIPAGSMVLELVDSLGLVIESDTSDGTSTAGDGVVDREGPALAGVAIPPFAVPPFFLRVTSTDFDAEWTPYRLFVKWMIAPAPTAEPFYVMPPGSSGFMGDIAAGPALDTDIVLLPVIPPFTAVHVSLDGAPAAPGPAPDLMLTLPAVISDAPINAAGMGAPLDRPAEAVFRDNDSALPIPPAFMAISTPPLVPPPPVPVPYEVLVTMHPHGMAAFSVGTVSVSEAAGTASVTVTRVGGSFGTISVDYRTTAAIPYGPVEDPIFVCSLAEPGSDFTEMTGTLTFGPGQVTATISVPIISDSDREFDEKLEVELFGAVNSLLPGIVRCGILILDDDDGDSSAATAHPLDLGTGTAQANGTISPPEDQEWVRFTAPAGARVTVVLHTGAGGAITEPILRLTLFAADGTWIASDRRDGWSGVMVPGGSLSRVPAIVSCPVAAGEYFLRVDAPEQNPAGPWRLCVALETAPAVAEVEPNDSTAEPLFLSPWPVSARTGDVSSGAADRFILTAPPGSVVLLGLDCDPERDGTSSELWLSIPEASGMVAFPGLGSSPDLADPAPRSAACFFEMPAGGSVTAVVRTDSPGTGTYRLTGAVISPGVLRIAPVPGCTVPVMFAEEGRAVSVTVERAMGNRGPASVRWSTGGGTATAGSDYISTTGTLNFAPGETVKTFTVTTLADALSEWSETVPVQLSEATGAALGVMVSVNGLAGPAPDGVVIIREPEPPNDVPCSAPLVTLTPPVTRLSAALAERAGDGTDAFDFINAVPGARLWALAVPAMPPVWPEFSSDPVLGLLAPGGVVLEQDDQASSLVGVISAPPLGRTVAIAGQALPGAGRYSVATSSQTTPPGQAAEYIRLEAVDPLDVYMTVTSGPEATEVESNNTMSTATPLLTLTRAVAVVAGTLSGTDQDWFRLELGRGDLLFVSLDERPGTAAALDAAVELIAPDGSLLVQMRGSLYDARPSESFVWTPDVPMAGTWFLRVAQRNPALPTTALPWRLMAARQSPPGPPGPVLSGITLPGTVEAGASFQLAGNLSGMDPGDTLQVRVTWGDGTPLQTVTLTAGATSFSIPHSYSQAAIARPIEFAVTNLTRGGTTVSATTIQVCLPAGADLTAWWPGDGHARDVIGSYDGALQSDPRYAAGMVDQAFNFDGLNDFIRMGDVAALNPEMSSFTVEAWFLRTGVPGSGAFRIASKGVSRASVPEWEGWALHGDSTNWIAFTVNDGTFLNYNRAGARGNAQASLPADGAWHHVAGVLDRTEGEVKLYLDGQRVLSRTTGTLGPVRTGLSFAIGAQDTLGGDPTRETTHFFPGLIDEVRFSRRALTDAEVQTAFLAGAAGHCKPAAALALMPEPAITLTPASGASTGGMVIAWPASDKGLRLEIADDLAAWRLPTALPELSGGQWQVTDTPAKRRFYRLTGR